MVEKFLTREELKAQRLKELFRGDSWALPPEMWLGGEITSEVERRLVALGWTEDQIGLFPLAVDEAFINAVMYGTFDIKVEAGLDKKEVREKLVREIEADGKFKDKRVRIESNLSADDAMVSIMDQGRGFSAEAIPDPTNPERLLEPTGRGVDLMKKVCDRVEFNGNTVALYKKRINEKR